MRTGSGRDRCVSRAVTADNTDKTLPPELFESYIPGRPGLNEGKSLEKFAATSKRVH